MTNDDTIWIAAYLEGEGCFIWQKSYSGGKLYRYPMITVSSTDLDVIENAARIMESSKPLRLKRKSPGKPMWMTRIGGKRSLAIMGLILPYMGKRRSERIRELFTLSSKRPGTPRGEKSYQSKLTWEAVKEIRTSRNRKKHGFMASMARKFGVNDGSIWYVLNGYTWKEEHRPRQDMVTTLFKK